ncbi:phage holin family protein [Mechercharimyces sp. CAU 1602]|uniref:phage holin family protein n=1 Tax=Mechercharimyces sp. CAU 1602 TaxID=2973933 RepID=UPI0021613EF7|nr:phage holin family protein [Mechercharimyces sp. CAU 1602]MCS1350524.1 phage holin family protein [Mechercharimyces sp. CAU 1602]
MRWENRLRNYGFWAAIAALIPIILQLFGIDIVPAKYEVIVNAILSVLVVFGVINNPDTQSRGYGDDKVLRPAIISHGRRRRK